MNQCIYNQIITKNKIVLKKVLIGDMKLKALKATMLISKKSSIFFSNIYSILLSPDSDSQVDKDLNRKIDHLLCKDKSDSGYKWGGGYGDAVICNQLIAFSFITINRSLRLSVP